MVFSVNISTRRVALFEAHPAFLAYSTTDNDTHTINDAMGDLIFTNRVAMSTCLSVCLSAPLGAPPPTLKIIFYPLHIFFWRKIMQPLEEEKKKRKINSELALH